MKHRNRWINVFLGLFWMLIWKLQLRSSKKSPVITWDGIAKFSLHEKWIKCPYHYMTVIASGLNNIGRRIIHLRLHPRASSWILVLDFFPSCCDKRWLICSLRLSANGHFFSTSRRHRIYLWNSIKLISFHKSIKCLHGSVIPWRKTDNQLF